MARRGRNSGVGTNERGQATAAVDLVVRYSWLKAGPLVLLLGVLTLAFAVFGISEGEVIALVLVPVVGLCSAFIGRHLFRRTPMMVVAADRLEFRGMRFPWSEIESIEPVTRYVRGWPQRTLRVELRDASLVTEQAPTRVLKGLAETMRHSGRPTIELPLNLMTASPRKIIAAVRARFAERAT